jgi:cbb3-type cytochrome oxidase maturation protein
MSVIFLLIPLSIVIATGFLLAFIWAVRSGQYEDTCTPSLRPLLDDPTPWHETDEPPSVKPTENRK